ncbi:MAG: NAD(P)-dependent alcohol dehydrogenase [Bifidobacteriaceae bacterium]|jgi:uncharacterized zinc-type alcohol dehydrogenase-like protein|nr:NAD(P)-dependent alcohol dehydrogenase [Bifidobacteriaceae bacterium]
MPHTVKALITPGPKAPFAAGTIDRREPGPADVVIAIEYSGVCHSDIHTARAEWGETIYPLVPGHEIAGTVTAVGSAVQKHALGDRVGVGCYVDSCGACQYCLAGQEQHCDKGAVFTYNSRDYQGDPTLGGYSAEIVVGQDYVLKIPDALDLAHAAPLLCAGITLYAPLKEWGAGPGVRVGIVGMGGLGHMGVKLASALGAEVTVLSRTLAKQADGLQFGAQAYRATSDPKTFTELALSFDLLISTVSATGEIDTLLGLLGTNGTLVFVGMPPGPQSVSISPLTTRRRKIAGSLIGGIALTQEMLDFCAAHGVAPEIELITADQVDATYDRVVAGDVRYRAVIDAHSI